MELPSPNAAPLKVGDIRLGHGSEIDPGELVRLADLVSSYLKDQQPGSGELQTAAIDPIRIPTEPGKTVTTRLRRTSPSEKEEVDK
jgi:hypothetical protein